MDAPQLKFATKLCYGVGQAAEGLKNGAFLWCYNHYHLTRERHEEIVAALITRRRDQRVIGEAA